MISPFEQLMGSTIAPSDINQNPFLATTTSPIRHHHQDQSLNPHLRQKSCAPTISLPRPLPPTTESSSSLISPLHKIMLMVHLDNCLYPKSMKIHDMMVIKIQQYFTKHLKISDEEANKLHQEYYQSYGLALEGLVRHHKIGTSPFEFLSSPLYPPLCVSPFVSLFIHTSFPRLRVGFLSYPLHVALVLG